MPLWVPSSRERIKVNPQGQKQDMTGCSDAKNRQQHSLPMLAAAITPPEKAHAAVAHKVSISPSPPLFSCKAEKHFG